MDLLFESDLIYKDAVSWRRHLHQNPELSLQENETAFFIENILKEFGIQDVKRIGKTGVVALIRGENSKKTIALRCDTDALPSEEKTTLIYKSKKTGVAHLCGHDMHTAILLSVAKILQKNKHFLGGGVKLIFQPAEEGFGGAKLMIENGVLVDPPVEAIFGLHCWPEAEAGKILVKRGVMCAASDRFLIKIFGNPGHAAHPDQCVDPVIIAGELISSLQTIVSREIAPYDPAVVTIGKINGGTAPNIIPEIIILEGTIRSLNPMVRKNIHASLKRISEGICSLNRGKCEVSIFKGPPALLNDGKMVRLVEDSAKRVVGDSKVEELFNPSLGAEDFAEYLAFSKGAFFRLGTGFPGGKNYPLHSSLFNPDEESLKNGIAVMAQIAFNYFKKPFYLH